MGGGGQWMTVEEMVDSVREVKTLHNVFFLLIYYKIGLNIIVTLPPHPLHKKKSHFVIRNVPGQS